MCVPAWTQPQAWCTEDLSDRYSNQQKDKQQAHFWPKSESGIGTEEAGQVGQPRPGRPTTPGLRGAQLAWRRGILRGTEEAEGVEGLQWRQLRGQV